MKCPSPISVARSFKVNGLPERAVVPCGKCLACRINRRSEWSLRMQLESSYWDSSTFLTLTYNDEFLPWQLCCADDSPFWSPTLVKRDYQLFMKRFRKRFGKPLKYYACGEYGGQTFRPHYHSILFGVNPVADYDLIKECWPSGNIMCLPVKAGSFNYVAGYVVDKLDGVLEQDAYYGCQPPFSLCSQGLGFDFLSDADIEKMLLDCEIVTCDGKHHSIPRYFLKKIPYDKVSAFIRSVERSDERLNKAFDFWRRNGFSKIDSNLKINESELKTFEELEQKTRQNVRSKL